ncbi:biotin transporter BioY [Yoonia sp. 208BN28-4]|uniref:biotin transporter BioY n=1 Tax=Yoonia sp. 208BN28-4 TaxID=3126505 RepID=UPI0030B138D2
MALAMNDKVLIEAFGENAQTVRRVKQALMVVLGIAVLALTAKIKVLLPGTPVPITLTTFAVLTIGAGYGARLGMLTVLGYLVVGAFGFDVFAGSSAENNGLVYMMGGTGGYLVGYALAAGALGLAARAGWDRSVLKMALAMLIGTALIYLPGLAWLYQFASGWEQTLAWGITPFLLGDAVKLALAALILPAVWKLIGDARK